jgi:hypothetical protein
MTILYLICAGIVFLLLTANTGSSNGVDDENFETSKNEKKKEKEYIPYSEEKMDNYFLEEWQKELVREGRFAPWSFKKKSTSSEPLSDGQYYKDDSDN